MTVDISSEAVERVARGVERYSGENPRDRAAATLRAQAERIKTLESAAMDRLVAEGQRCDDMTPQEAAKVKPLTLKDFGYAPGGYTIRCKECGDITDFDKMPVADKRAWRCKKHAEGALARAISEDSHE